MPAIIARGRIGRPRRRWNPGPAHKKLFSYSHYSANSPPVAGAIIPPYKVPKRLPKAPRVELRNVPDPFDLVVILAAPASGTVSALITAAQLGTVPDGMRMVIDGIVTILEAAAGPFPGPRIIGAGVTITWAFQIDGGPAYPYNNVTTILNDIGQDRPLLEVAARRRLTVNVTNVDPGGLYTQLGVRVRGRYIPWVYDEKGGR